MSELLFDAFLRTLENDALRTDVRDQARLQVVFSAQRDWSVAAIRDTLRVLLTRDAGERAAFDRSFDAFFRQSLQCDREPRIDVTDMLAQLRARLPDDAMTSAPPATGPAVAARRRPDSQAERETGWSAWRRRIAQPFRRLAQRVRALVHRLRDWLDDWRESHRRQEPPPAEETIPWQVNVDRQTFSFASVGAPLEPILTSRQVKRLADMLGFFRTDMAGRRLDVPATVRAAVRAGDPGRMCFQPLAATRHVLLLEDALALRDFRTSLVDELCAGFEATGVTVERGRFRHAVDRWTNRRGAEVDLGDLESEREGYVVLVFTDGSSFGRPPAWQSLARLAGWPRVAWIDWREPRSRIAASQVPGAAGIPQFSATPEGLLAAFTSFLMQGRRLDESDAAVPLVAGLAESQMGLDRYLDAVLDDSFLWAADCSLLQPCSPALAERLRRRFHPAVPRIALQRLVRLPGIRQDAAGMAFAPPTLAVLRRGWLARRPDDQQEAVLRFIEGQLQAARPTAAPEGSLAQLLWTAGVERVRLELDRNNDLIRFAQVLHSPAGRWLLSSLAGHFAPGCAIKQDQVVPLRVAPVDEQARGRLAQAVPGANVDARPTPPPQPRELDIVWIEPGEFLMGSPESEAGRFDNERQHRVRITRRFGIGKDPVTQTQYADVMGTNPSHFQNAGPDAPVEQVSWEDALEFCRRLTELGRQSGKLPEGYEYTLPTEAQWEYACRAGTAQATYAGDLQILGECNSPALDPVAWYAGNSGVEYEGGWDSSGWPKKQYDHQRAGTHPVGEKRPNTAGLHDMLGNVWEWCADWYGEHGDGDAVDPWGPDEGSFRLVRGGAWFYFARFCRSACRFRGDPGERGQYLGFRVAAVQSAELQAREREGRPRARELVWLEPGEFAMGSPEIEAGRGENERQHRVRITRRFALGKDPVTQSQYEEVMGTNPSYFQHAGSDAPVEQVSWDEAIEYCRRLTELDRQSGKLPEGYEYTLPTEAQWECACRAGSKEATYAGDLEILGQRNAPVLDPIAWYGGNSGVEYDGARDSSSWPEKQYDHQRAGTHPVGQKQPNGSGLHDMLGNVWEWCVDWFAEYGEGNAVDPWGPDEGSFRLVRGGAWYYFARFCRSACRGRVVPGGRIRYLGFRVAAVQSAELEAREREGRPRARELLWLEPGEFLMGSPENEAGRRDNERQHRVRITRRFGIGKCPVTQSQYEQIMGTNPSHFQQVGPDAPVEKVSWEDAMEYCRRLTELDRQSGKLPEWYEYTLPTEAQWEYACRAGTTTQFHFGDSLSSSQANFNGNYPYGAEKGPYLERTTPVGTYAPNAWGLYDMHGNVWEWCYDWYGAYTTGDAVDPTGPQTGSSRLVRGGAWANDARLCRSACRYGFDPGGRYQDLGFRVAAVQSGERQASEPEGRRRAREL